MTPQPQPRPVQLVPPPHGGGRVATSGRPLAEASGAVVLVHGRGASAEDILTLAAELDRPDLANLAPQAAGGTWYPQSFLAPLAANEPGLSSALAVLAALVARVEAAGIPAARLVLAGFSQGACLALEFAARHPRRYAAVAGLTGGLIGPAGTPRDYAGSLAGTPVLLAAGDPDPHVPWARVEETARVLGGLGARVDLRRYPGLPHTVNGEEIAALRALLPGAEAGG
jgi:predicted esterase